MKSRTGENQSDGPLITLLVVTVLIGLFGFGSAGFSFVVHDRGLKVYTKSPAGFYSVLVDARSANAHDLAQRHPLIASRMYHAGDWHLLAPRPRNTRPSRAASGQRPLRAPTASTGGAAASQPSPPRRTADRTQSGSLGGPAQGPAGHASIPPGVIPALRSYGVILPDERLTGEVLAIVSSVDPENPISVTRAATELKFVLGAEAGRQGIEALRRLEEDPQARQRSADLVGQGAREVGRLLRSLGNHDP